MGTTIEHSKIELSISQSVDILKHIITNNRFLEESGKKKTAVLFEGDSGLGKTSLVLQTAEEMGLGMVKLNLSQFEEIGDLTGFPLKQFQMCKQGSDPVTELRKVKKITKVPTKEIKLVNKQVLNAEGKPELKQVKAEVTVMKDVESVVEELVTISSGVDYTCEWVDEVAIEQFKANGFTLTGEKRMTYAPPEWVADKGPGYILLLDDFTRADLRFMQGVMDLIDRQEFASWKLPEDWHIVLTSNPDGKDYYVQSLDEAQRTRYVSFSVKFNVDDWAQWAEKEGIDGRCINFTLLNPEIVSTKVNPRSIVTFFNTISSIPDFSKNLDLIQMLGEASVGPEFASMFTAFINNRLDKIMKPQDILFKGTHEELAKSLLECVGMGDTYRADIASVLMTRTINHALVYAETNTINSTLIERLTYLSLEELFTNDLKYVLVKKLLNGNKQKFQKLTANEQVSDMLLT